MVRRDRPAQVGWRSRTHRAIFVVLCLGLGLTGCLGPSAVKHSRIKYNEAYRDTNDQQILLNVVRLRYADSPVVIDLPGITSQFEVSGQGSFTGGYGNQFEGRSSLGLGGLTLRDAPTLSYHPREGREMTRGLLNPLSAELFTVVNMGANVEQLFLMAVNDFNDVPNAPMATLFLPTAPDNNDRFRQGIRLLSELIRRDGVELLIGTTEEDDEASDPIPASAIKGSDVLNAAKGGYVYRARDNGTVVLVKRDRGLVLKVRADFVNDPDMLALAEIFRFLPGKRIYRIKSELTADATTRRLKALPDDTIYLNMRSVLQIATFLSKGVCVPAEHITTGVAPTIPGPEGRPFDWTQITSGLFFVHSSKHRPKNAETAVFYRGYWFYIPTDDVRSRSVMAILEMIFSLEEAEDRAAGPALALPLGG